MKPLSECKALQNREVETRLPGARTTPENFEAVARRKRSVFTLPNRRYVLASVPAALVFAALALLIIFYTRPYSATVRLLKNERMFASPTDAHDFIGLASSPASLAEVARTLPHGMTPADIGAQCRIEASDGGSVLNIVAVSKSPSGTILLANAFSERVL